MARAVRSGTRPLASGELAYHILDTMTAICEAATTHRTFEIHSTVAGVPLVSEHWDPFAATL